MPQITGRDDRLLAQGQAALTLIESVLLVLIEAGIVDKEQMLEAIETVIPSKRSLTEEEENRTVAAAAIGLLTGVANSLRAARSGGKDAGCPRE